MVRAQSKIFTIRVADLILPVFPMILSGWIAGYTGYLSRALSDALIHFAYNIAITVWKAFPFAYFPRRKTAADCFRFPNKIGLDVEIEALGDCLRQKKASINEIHRYTKTLSRESRHSSLHERTLIREHNNNAAASIRARLLILAQARGEDYQRVVSHGIIYCISSKHFSRLVVVSRVFRTFDLSWDLGRLLG